MATTTVRITERSHQVLRQFSEQRSISIVEALDEILADWERRQFFESLNTSFAALRSDTEAWSEEVEERRLWESTLQDNLENDEEATSR